MTANQITQLRKVINKLNDIRQTLDEVVYSEPISDMEYGQVRECYDMICEVIDKLYNV